MNKLELEKLIEDALEVEKGTITKTTKMEDVNEWDSLGHLSILIKLDNFFGGAASQLEDLAQATSVKEIEDILKKANLLKGI
mgnify:CR=1 FL=1